MPVEPGPWLKSVPFAQAVTSVLAMAVLREERRQQLLEGDRAERRGEEGRIEEKRDARRRHKEVALLPGLAVLGRARLALLAVEARHLLARHLQRLGRVDDGEDLLAREEAGVCGGSESEGELQREPAEGEDEGEEDAPSSSLSRSMRIVLSSLAMPQQPNMSDAGNGHLQVTSSTSAGARSTSERERGERAREEDARLRRVVACVADDDAGLLVHLAPDRLLERLARLDKACEARVEACRPRAL